MTPITQPLWLSVRISLVATLLTMLVGIPLAFVMARRRFRGKSLLEGTIMMPLVLPPTVVGYFIIMVLGARGWIGQWIYRWTEYSIIFRFEGAVLAAAIVALPMLYIPARAAFASVDPDLEDLAKSLGANRLQMFWHVSIPLARRSLASGAILAFARALGEFGATMMVFGNIPARGVTLPISVYLDVEQGNLYAATGSVLALVVTSLTLILVYNNTIARTDRR